MASGDSLLLLRPKGVDLPTSTPAVHLPLSNNNHVLEFDPSTSWSCFWAFVLPKNYGGNGLTVKVHWAAAAAGAGNVGWRGYFSRDNAGADISSDSNYTSAQSSTFDGANGANIIVVSSIAFTSGQIGSLAVHESGRFKLDRDAANASDTFASRARLYSVEIQET